MRDRIECPLLGGVKTAQSGHKQLMRQHGDVRKSSGPSRMMSFMDRLRCVVVAGAVLTVPNLAVSQDKPTKAQLAASAREGLLVELERECRRLKPSYNGITTVAERDGKGWVLYCKHPMFSRYSFSVGDFGPSLASFIPRFKSRISEVQVVGIGVVNDRSDGAVLPVP